MDMYFNEKSGTGEDGHPGFAVYVNEADAVPTFFYIRRGIKEEKI